MVETIVRTALGQFKAGGPSPNPGGRSRTVKPVQELARQHTEEAINQLRFLMHKGENDYIKLAATQELLSRGWGRNVTPIVAAVGEVSEERKAELDYVMAELRTLRFERTDSPPLLTLQSESNDDA